MRAPTPTGRITWALTLYLVLCCSAGCPKPKPATEAVPSPLDTPAADVESPPVTMISEEEFPENWDGLVDMPGTNDPELVLLAQRVLYPCGLSRHCEELPLHAWEVYAQRLDDRLDADAPAFAHWLMAQVQLKLWWCGPGYEPLDVAERHAARALELAPDSACALAVSALVESCRDDSEKALGLATAAVDARPDLPYPLATQALVYRHLDRYDEALKAYDKVLELNIRAIVVNLYRGHCYWEMGDYESALAAYEDLARLSPDYALGHLNCAFAYYREDRKYDAEESLLEAIRCDSRLSEAHRLLGTIYYERYEYDKAREALNYALMADPLNDNAHYYMGHWYYSNSLLGKALESYQRADELAPDEVETWCSIGKTHYLLGNYGEATEALEKAIGMSDPGYWAYDEAVETLGLITSSTSP